HCLRGAEGTEQEPKLDAETSALAKALADLPEEQRKALAKIIGGGDVG
ncbi:unnamed protein product, partial [marine sediment metagenome]